MQSACAIRLHVKRALRSLQFFQPLPHLFLRLLGEPAAHLAHGDQAILIVIQSQHQRSEVFSAAARVSVSADHTLLPLRDFYLQLLAAALLLVTTIAALSYDP